MNYVLLRLCMVRVCSYFVVKIFYYGPYCVLIVVDSIDMESCILLQHYVADNISIYGQKVIEHSKKIDALRRRPVWIYISASFWRCGIVWLQNCIIIFLSRKTRYNFEQTYISRLASLPKADVHVLNAEGKQRLKKIIFL